MSGQNRGVQYKIRAFRLIAAQCGLFAQRSDQSRNGGWDLREIDAQFDYKARHLFDHFVQPFESLMSGAGELKDCAWRERQQTCRSGDFFESRFLATCYPRQENRPDGKTGRYLSGKMWMQKIERLLAVQMIGIIERRRQKWKSSNIFGVYFAGAVNAVYVRRRVGRDQAIVVAGVKQRRVETAKTRRRLYGPAFSDE